MNKRYFVCAKKGVEHCVPVVLGTWEYSDTMSHNHKSIHALLELCVTQRM